MIEGVPLYDKMETSTNNVQLVFIRVGRYAQDTTLRNDSVKDNNYSDALPFVNVFAVIMVKICVLL